MSKRYTQKVTERDREKCTSAGVFPLFRGSFELSNLQTLMSDANNSEKNKGVFSEHTILLTPEVHTPFEEWDELWTEKDREKYANWIENNTDEEHRELAAQSIEPNMMLKQILIECRKHANLDSFKTCLGVEAFTSNAYKHTRGLYDRSNYSIFTGSRDKYERPLETAAREMREEGKLVLAPKFWSFQHQLKMREKYNLKFLPSYMKITLRPNRFMKVFLMLIDDAKAEINEDENGPYVYLLPNQKK